MNADKTDKGVTETVASFVQATTLTDLPQSVRHSARRAFVNIVGCCLGGANHEIVEITSRALMPFAGIGTTTVLGRTERADMLTAALLNCLSSAACSFDDTHAAAIVHPSGAVATALLALAEHQTITGEEFLLAFVLGVEIACRLSKAVSVAPATGEIAWSQTGIAAGIGSAVAAAKVMGLDLKRTSWAIGIAALQASGFRVAHGTMSATLIFGHAAQTGLRAAVLARQGLTAPVAPLEGKYGYSSLFSTRPHLDYLTDSLGTSFEVEALAYKPYPCGVVIHPSLDAALQWVRLHGLNYESIERILIKVHPSATALGFRRHPAGVLEAKVSLYHWVAVAFAYGRASIADGQQEAIDDPAVAALRDRILVESDIAIGTDGAVMTVIAKNGDEHKIAVVHCRGSVGNPMSDDDLDDKFLGQANINVSRASAASLLKKCWNVDSLRDVADISQEARRGVQEFGEPLGDEQR